MSKNILVLGASGFIAGHLIDSLLADNHIIHTASSKPLTRHTNTKHYIGNLTDQHFVTMLFRQAVYDEVYMLASVNGGSNYINAGTYDADIMSDSMLMTIHVAKCCVEYKAKCLFFPSSACVHSSNTDNNTNNTDITDKYCENEYGWTKLFTERMLMAFKNQYGLKVRIARLYNIVGEYAVWQGGLEKAHAALARKVAMAEDGGTIDIVGDGQQLRSFLHAKDCVKAMRMMMMSDCEEILNIGSDEAISINDYVKLLSVISNKSIHINYIDGPTGIKERRCDVSKIKMLLGWERTYSLYDTTRMTYDYIVGELKKRTDAL